MKIENISKFKNIKYNQLNQIQYVSFRQSDVKNLQKDEFVSDDLTQEKLEASKKAGILAGGALVLYGLYRLSRGKIINRASDLYLQPLEYIDNLAQDMSKALSKKIDCKQLSAVMTPNELLEVLPKFKKENYFAYRQDILPNIGYKKVFDENNINNGIFKIDLHSHTNYSDGQAKVSDLLDNVVEYANKFNAKTNEKFIFSITDHDGVGGTKEALKLIAENPEKFKNLRFVPGVELTFAHLGKNNTVEVSELLAHCINPYSPKLNEFIDKTLAGRKNLFTNLINDLNNSNSGVKFDIKEIDGDFFNLRDDKNWFKYNLHWSVFNYVQIKQRLSKLAQKWGKNPEDIYREIMPQWHVGQSQKTPWSFEEFMLSRNVDLSDTQRIDKSIDEVCAKYFPRIENGKIVATSERTFDDVVGFFNNDKNVILGFAHPAFTAQKVENPRLFFKDLIEKSNGLIKTTERHHMSYFLPIKNGSVTQEMIDTTNRTIDEFNLLNIGGHDNHNMTLL